MHKNTRRNYQYLFLSHTYMSRSLTDGFKAAGVSAVGGRELEISLSALITRIKFLYRFFISGKNRPHLNRGTSLPFTGVQVADRFPFLLIFMLLYFYIGCAYAPA